MKKQLISIMCAMTLTCSATAISVSDFTDVHQSDWYHDAVSYAVSNRLFSGTSNVTFSPNVSITRLISHGKTAKGLYLVQEMVCFAKCCRHPREDYKNPVHLREKRWHKYR